MNFKAYGAQAFREMIQKDIDLTRYLAQKIDAASDFKLFNTPELSAVCFQYIGEGYRSDQDINNLNQELLNELERDGRVFITGTQLHGHAVIRACLVNHRKQQEHVEFLLDVIRELGNKLV
jgi:glutamate/tyrosine decarboxylase-like PLP-dependent enzyme